MGLRRIHRYRRGVIRGLGGGGPTMSTKIKARRRRPKLAPAPSWHPSKAMTGWICSLLDHRPLDLPKVKALRAAAEPGAHYSCMCGVSDRGPIIVTESIRCWCGFAIVRTIGTDPRNRFNPDERRLHHDTCPSCLRRVIGYTWPSDQPPTSVLAPLVRLWGVVTARRLRLAWREARKR